VISVKYNSMECIEVRKIIGDYVAHRLDADKVSGLEAHLCVCAECRSFLAERLDTEEDPGCSPDQGKAEERASVSFSPDSDSGVGDLPFSRSSTELSPGLIRFSLILACLAVIFIFVLFLKTRSLGMQ